MVLRMCYGALMASTAYPNVTPSPSYRDTFDINGCSYQANPRFTKNFGLELATKVLTKGPMAVMVPVNFNHVPLNASICASEASIFGHAYNKKISLSLQLMFTTRGAGKILFDLYLRMGFSLNKNLQNDFDIHPIKIYVPNMVDLYDTLGPISSYQDVPYIVKLLQHLDRIVPDTLEALQDEINPLKKVEVVADAFIPSIDTEWCVLD